MQLAWKFAVIALVALLLVALPGGGSALDVRAHAAHRGVLRGDRPAGGAHCTGSTGSTSTASTSSIRFVLYGALALAVLTFTATERLFDAGGAGVLAWFALLALASYGLYWVWTRYRSYE